MASYQPQRNTRSRERLMQQFLADHVPYRANFDNNKAKSGGKMFNAQNQNHFHFTDMDLSAFVSWFEDSGPDQGMENQTLPQQVEDHRRGHTPEPCLEMASPPPVPSVAALPFDNVISDFTKRIQHIKLTYREILKDFKIDRANLSNRHRSKFKFILDNIVDSKNIFVPISKDFIRALSSMSSLSAAARDTVMTICAKIHWALTIRTTTLKLLRAVISDIYRKFRNRKSLSGVPKDLSEYPVAEFKAFLEYKNPNIDMSCFENLARELIKLVEASGAWRKGAGVPSEELKTLCTEGRASSRIYEGLCRACPVPEHATCGHTAHLSLRPGKVDKLKPRPRPRLTGKQTMTECHMAIKSTISSEDRRIWLRVVSYVERRKRKGAKRRASYGSGTMSSDREADAGSASEIRVCPEYLAQHDGEDLVVMQMVDPRGSSHDFYYLPSELRPREDRKDENLASPITLPELLLRSRRDTKYMVHYGAMQWRVHTARLIAEAVLRWNRLGASPSRAKDKVIFYPVGLTEGAGSLEPFLEAQIENSDEAASTAASVATGGCDEDVAFGGRRAVLLNLGHILLQLGMYTPIDIPSDHPADWSQSIIRINSHNIEWSDVYADVVRSCVNFFGDEEGYQGRTDEEFQERYYKLIVQPLQQLDKTLQEHSFSGICKNT